MSDLLGEIARYVEQGDGQNTRLLVELALKNGIDPIDIFEQGLAKGVRRTGDCFGRGEVFLTELMLAADAIKSGLEVLQPELKKKGKQVSTIGRVVIGTVKGDIHDLGKNIISTMLQVNGFDVIDLSVDVSPMTFIERALETNADVIGLSALMTTTLPFQGDVTRSLTEMGLRSKFKVIIGGAPVTSEWASEIGADGYATDALPGVERVKQLVSAHAD